MRSAGVRQTGDDLLLFVDKADRHAGFAAQDAARKAAMNARNDLRRQIRSRFGRSGRVWNTKGFAASVVVKKISDEVWQVVDRAVYSKKRRQEVGLLWVFDASPVIHGKRSWVAVPIQGQAPIHRNGRRYAWPSEAAAMGWQLETANAGGTKPVKVIFGRLNRLEPFRPLYFLIPPYRMKRRLDLRATHLKHEAKMPDLWAEAFDKRMMKVPRRRAA